MSDMLRDDETYCHRCGKRYDCVNQDPPENATVYWVPKCPECNAKMTDNVVDSTLVEIASQPSGGEVRVEKVHAYARLLHGRLVDMSASELIDRARYFDERANHDVWGPFREHHVAFELRRQAREKLRGDGGE
jgi:hypothetical protein